MYGAASVDLGWTASDRFYSQLSVISLSGTPPSPTVLVRFPEEGKAAVTGGQSVNVTRNIPLASLHGIAEPWQFLLQVRHVFHGRNCSFIVHSFTL